MRYSPHPALPRSTGGGDTTGSTGRGDHLAEGATHLCSSVASSLYFFAPSWLHPFLVYKEQLVAAEQDAHVAGEGVAAALVPGDAGVGQPGGTGAEVVGDEGIVLRVLPLRGEREGVRRGGGAVEVPAQRQHRVANLLRREAARVLPPEVRVGRVNSGVGAVGGVFEAGQLVCAGEH